MTTWLETLPGVRRNHSLESHTTYRIGGAADWYIEARSEIGDLIRGARERAIPVTVLGNGSNVLISDLGIEGLVVRTADTAIVVHGDQVEAAAGARMVKVAQAAEAAGLTGMEWALGIPGCVGGSVHNNAGCFGSDIAAAVGAVHGVNRAGAAAVWDGAECAFAYRTSALRHGKLEGGVVTAATFRLYPGDPAAIHARMRDIQAERRATQPVSGRSTGSVFKNPDGDFAGRLVDAAGLKGARVGGAMVSLEHANFIVNAGGARAADVATLMHRVQLEVRHRFGVHLEPEIQAMGRWPDGLPEAFR